ncbi:MAG: hypothetical protein ACRYF5_15240, partial [Janthinobacterium lividum]
YLYGRRDLIGWLHVLSLPLSQLLYWQGSGMVRLLSLSPLLLSAMISMFEALAIGLCADENWDARHNPRSEQRSNSKWLLALTLIATVAVGATALIAMIARGIDLYLTGGAYG